MAETPAKEETFYPGARAGCACSCYVMVMRRRTASTERHTHACSDFRRRLLAVGRVRTGSEAAIDLGPFLECPDHSSVRSGLRLQPVNATRHRHASGWSVAWHAGPPDSLPKARCPCCGSAGRKASRFTRSPGYWTERTPRYAGCLLEPAAFAPPHSQVRHSPNRSSHHDLVFAAPADWTQVKLRHGAAVMRARFHSSRSRVPWIGVVLSCPLFQQPSSPHHAFNRFPVSAAWCV